MKEYFTKQQTDKLFKRITSNGNREMTETRFHQAINEALIIYEIVGEYLFCGYCGQKKSFNVPTDINSGRVCKNPFCKG